MPDLDGWKVLETVLQTPSPPRVIIITAHGKEDYERIAKEKRAWAYVEKTNMIQKTKQILKEAVPS